MRLAPLRTRAMAGAQREIEVTLAAWIEAVTHELLDVGGLASASEFEYMYVSQLPGEDSSWSVRCKHERVEASWGQV